MPPTDRSIGVDIDGLIAVVVTMRGNALALRFQASDDVTCRVSHGISRV